jgi:hypothetical protein
MTKKIGKKIRSDFISLVENGCREKNLSPKALAQDAACNERTVRNFLNGKSVKDETLRRIVSAVGIDFDSVLARKEPSSTSARHGLYSVDLVQGYVGCFYAYRFSFSVADRIIRSLFELRWDSERSCLIFREYHTYNSDHLGRLVSYDQSGEVFMSNSIGLVHLLTVDAGAVRLITLTRLHPQDEFMCGAVLTQSEWPGRYQPSTSPIYFQKILNGDHPQELIHAVGPARPSDPDYSGARRGLLQAQANVVRFAGVKLS